MEGFIKIYRKIREHWIWENSDYLKWWLDLLMMANHKPKKTLINGMPKVIDVGECHTSETKLSERWHTSRKAVDNFLKKLLMDEMLSIKKSRQNGTTIKISNYHMYQAVFDGDGTSKEQRGNNESTTKAHKQEPKNEKNNTFSSEHDSDGEKIIENEEPKPPGRKKNEYAHDNVYYKTAKWLAANIESSITGYKPHTESQLQTWADEVRKLIEVDKRDVETARKLLAFARNDSFWQSNILSMRKFREQYDTLLVKYNLKHEGELKNDAR